MGLRLGRRAPPAAPEPESPPTAEELEEQQFEERVYLALMEIARASSPRLRNALGSCVMLRTTYAKAPPEVRQAIAEFIAEADI